MRPSCAKFSSGDLRYPCVTDPMIFARPQSLDCFEHIVSIILTGFVLTIVEDAILVVRGMCSVL